MSALLLGGTYIEIDGLLYPNLVMEGEDVNAFSGKFGDLWKHYMEENHLERYRLLVRLGILNQTAKRGNRITRYCVLQSLRRKRGQIL